jgi:hypothetical protein
MMSPPDEEARMRRFPGFAATLLVLALGVPTPGAAQAKPGVGERIRILTVNGDSYAGTLSAASAEGLVISGALGGRAVRPSEIAYLERSSRRYRRFGRNFLFSIMATGLTTGTIAAAAWSPCVSNQFLGCLMASDSRSEEFAVGLVVGSVLFGIPLGTITGSVIKYDEWEEIPLPGTEKSTVTIAPVLDRGFGLSASISF